MFFTCTLNAQVVFNNNLDEINTDVCVGTYKKLAVSTVKGTCDNFLGNVNSVSFVWQIESSPGNWQDVNLFNITGVTYAVEQRINAGGTVISSILTVNLDQSPSEAVWQYRVLAQGSGGCPVATSLTEGIAIKKNHWTGVVSTSWVDPANWSCNRVPSASTSAIVDPATNNPSISTSASAKELTLSSGSILDVESGYNLTVSGPVTVQGTGNLTLQNNANLLQGSYEGVNFGNITVKRNSSALNRLDYTLWSSPVSGQNLLTFSPLTMTNRFYEYNPDTNLYTTIDPIANNFQTGKGYLIRMPNNHPVTPTNWNGSFTGVPINGTVSLNLYNGGVGKRFNAIGNPYPSPIKMSSFVSLNSGKITGALYFWRKSNSTVTEPGYCTWTSAGFVSNGEAQVFNPAGVIRTGQGFLVELVNNETNVVFNNGMRLANNANQFFRTESESEELVGDKFWLSIGNSSGTRNQMLLGYFEEATTAVDYGIDGKAIGALPVSLTMLIGTDNYVIQGRPIFNEEDIVPLNFKVDAAGQYTISIDNLEGVFLSSQNVYLKDKTTNVIHNLKTGNYIFMSEAGEFSNRFEIIYRDATLNTDTSTLNTDSIVVYKENNMLQVKGYNVNLNNVKVFDVQGRLLNEKNAINTFETSVQMGNENQILVIKIMTDNGNVVTKKIRY